MKKLLESILDDSDILMNNTSIDKDFPDKSNYQYIYDGFKSKFYIWESPALFTRLQNISNNKNWNKYKSILVAWTTLYNNDNIPAGKQNNLYNINILISPEGKGNACYYNTNLIKSKNYYSAYVSKNYAYKILNTIKDDPKVLDDIFKNSTSGFSKLKIEDYFKR